MKNAYLYLRTAVCSQAGTSNNLKLQEQTLNDWAVKNDYLVKGTFVDEGISGNSIRRPGINRLIRKCKSKDVDTVLISRNDRLGRNIRVCFSIITQLKKLGVGIISLEYPHSFLHEMFAYKVLCDSLKINKSIK